MSLEAVNSRSRYLKDTKTKNSKRELQLNEETVKELLEHKLLMALVKRTNDNDFVFSKVRMDSKK